LGIEVLQTQDLFFRQLKDIFIGAKIEGQSGFINLMKIKSSYFDSIFKELVKEIEDRTEDFPEFREELFDKLYSFFKTYFSESGSIYFRYTPLKSIPIKKMLPCSGKLICFIMPNPTVSGIA
jgi:malate synthase